MSQKEFQKKRFSIQSQVNILTLSANSSNYENRGKSLFNAGSISRWKRHHLSSDGRKQLFHCFSCGRGGNVFNFMQELKLVFPNPWFELLNSNIDIDVELPTQTIIPEKREEIIWGHEKRLSFYSFVLLNTRGERSAWLFRKSWYTVETFKRIRIWFFFKRQNTIRTNPPQHLID